MIQRAEAAADIGQTKCKFYIIMNLIIPTKFLTINEVGIKMAINNASELKKEVESFKVSTKKISEKINGVGDIWRDNNYTSLQTQMGELAKTSRIVIENGERVCSSIDKFFNIAAEEV